jgi:hypothetical protein
MVAGRRGLLSLKIPTCWRHLRVVSQTKLSKPMRNVVLTLRSVLDRFGRGGRRDVLELTEPANYVALFVIAATLGVLAVWSSKYSNPAMGKRAG